jgi:hypothetical protein
MRAIRKQPKNKYASSVLGKAFKKERNMKRRTFLKSAGVVTVLVVGTHVFWRICDRGVFSTGQGAAYEPWKNWRSGKSEGSLTLVRAAILAANPHDTQPWLFRVSASRIEMFADPNRRIGAIDPYLREMHIGLGCALENLLLAADANGYSYHLSLLPEPSNPNYVASIDLSPGPTFASDLYKAIPDRHTNRGAYVKEKPVSSTVLDQLKSLGKNEPDVKLFWFATEAERLRVGDLIIQATEAIIADQEQSHDSAAWFRYTWKDLQQYRDGITLDATGSPWHIRALAKVLPPQSPEKNDQFWLKTVKEVSVATASAFGLLAVRNQGDRSQMMRCGRIWQRMHLWATVQGVAMQPLNQMPERAAREEVLHIQPQFGKVLQELTGGSEWQALMVFRTGYPTTAALPSPRRSIEEVIVQ